MSRKGKLQTSKKELKAQIDAYIGALAEATDEALVSSTMTAFLETCSKFHKYSPGNAIIIKMARPDATMVAGFIDWRKKHKRHVKKGEKGIPILAPIFVKDDDETGGYKLVAFRVAHVFDVAQTEGQPIAEAPDWKSLEKNTELNRNLVEFAISHKIIVTEKEFEDETQGISLGGEIQIAPTAGTKTIVHEIAHELLHKENGASTQVKEMEAEAVAYVVCRHFNLNELASPNYIALHGADSKMIAKHLTTIQKTATQIIQAVEK